MVTPVKNPGRTVKTYTPKGDFIRQFASSVGNNPSPPGNHRSADPVDRLRIFDFALFRAHGFWNEKDREILQDLSGLLSMF